MEDSDESILTRRDYAYFLARLRLGVPHKNLRQLQWGQIQIDDSGAWVTWTDEHERSSIPEDVFQAILEYLKASGRLEGLRPQAYIFAPLLDPLKQAAGDHPGDWDDSRCLGNAQIWETLKRYGRLAGIPDPKLTMRALRHTAVMLRLEVGDDLEAVHAFLHAPSPQLVPTSQLVSTSQYLKALPPPDPHNEDLRDLQADPPQLPDRKPCHFKPWDNMTHGMSARRQPPEEVAAILAEEIQGMEEEITGVRVLHRELLEMQKRTTDPGEVALLTDAYSRSAARLANMIQIDDELKKRRKQDNWPEEFLQRLAEGAWERGEEFDIEVEKDLAWGGEGALAANARRLAEEIAGTRVALRRTYQLAMESEGVHRRAYLTDIYGRGCSRLVKLLQMEGDGQTRLKIYINQTVDDVILAIQEEWGLQ